MESLVPIPPKIDDIHRHIRTAFQIPESTVNELGQLPFARVVTTGEDLQTAFRFTKDTRYRLTCASRTQINMLLASFLDHLNHANLAYFN